MPGYAVVDVETTGRHPATDRIAEIAIVRLDPTGRVEDTWTSLVNPHRDLGPVHIHHIEQADADAAPDFEQLAGDTIQRLRGRVFVAHNGLFDAGFVHNEFNRLGIAIPDLVELLACTRQLAGRLAPIPRRTLANLCRHFDIELRDAHTALGDAEATAEVFGRYLRLCAVPADAADPAAAWRRPVPWSAQQDAADAGRWPDLAPSGVAPRLRSGAPIVVEPMPATQPEQLTLFD